MVYKANTCTHANNINLLLTALKIDANAFPSKNRGLTPLKWGDIDPVYVSDMLYLMITLSNFMCQGMHKGRKKSYSSRSLSFRYNKSPPCKTLCNSCLPQF